MVRLMDASFFDANRQRLMNLLPGALIVVPAYTKLQRSNDAAHAFEQEANFWYISGITHADWYVICDGSIGKSWLVSPAIDKQHEIFDGALSPESAKLISGIGTVLQADEADLLLRKLAKKHSVVYTTQHPSYAHMFDFTLNPALPKMQQKLERIFPKVQQCNKELTKLRAIKQPIEIRMIEKAIAITADALTTVRKSMATYNYEYQIDADITREFRYHGASGHAYDPIVAAGKNACTLHYVANNERLKKRQMVLLDVGARYGGYAADYTHLCLRRTNKTATDDTSLLGERPKGDHSFAWPRDEC